jgi:hypothetical protein
MKKSLLLGTVLAVIANGAGHSRATGFYVGVMGSANILRFKLINKDNHPTGQTVTSMANVDASYAGVDGTTPVPKGTAERTATAVTYDVNQVLASTGSFVSLPVTYKVRPSATFFVGVRTAVGSAICVGAEVRGTKAFGNFKYEGVASVPALKEYTLSTDKLKVVPKGSEIPSASYPMTLTINKVGSIDGFIVVGIYLPGSDKRTQFYVGVGGGVDRLKLTVTQTGVGFHYFKAIADSILHSAKAQANKSKADLTTNSTDHVTRGRYVSAQYGRDVYYNLRTFNGYLDGYAAASNNPYDVLDLFLYGAGTNHEFNKAFSPLLKDPDVSVEKWNTHVGGLIGLDFSVSPSVAVRCELALMYCKKVDMSKIEQIQHVGASAIESAISGAFKDRTFDDALDQIRVPNAEGELTQALSAADKTAAAAAVKDSFKNGLNGKDATFGNFEYGYGLEKHFDAKFSVGVSFRF